MKLKDFSHIYFLGIGGIGMSALARLCLRWEMQVSGYDRSSSDLTDQLEKEGAEIFFEDSEDAISTPPDLVIYTPAIPKDSWLLNYFRNSGVQMIKRSEALGLVTEGVTTIAVAGTHGKTTTSSMISYLLTACGVPHTALLGGILVNYQSNFFSEGLNLIVTEADEYDRSFLRLHPKYLVVTAMDADHLDIYGTEEEMIKAYRQFILQIQDNGILVFRSGLEEKISTDVFNSLSARGIKVHSYGINEGEYQIRNWEVRGGIWHWNIESDHDKINGLALSMPGRHNVSNATAAVITAMYAGAMKSRIIEKMPGYKGVSRRFEIRYQDSKNVLIDDYAHHPEELIAAITAARETYGRPVTGVFQPHLFTRTRDFAMEFAEALDELDVPVVIDIYPAREEPIEGVSSQMLYDLMKNPNKMYARGDSWVNWVIGQHPKTLLILGAGNLDRHIPEIIRQMYK